METFIVRLWWPAGERPAGAAQLRGVVDEVATGERRPFATADELLALLREKAPAQAEEAPASILDA